MRGLGRGSRASQGMWKDEDDYPTLTQAQSIAGVTDAHFWPMQETGTFTAITDIIGGVAIDNTGPDAVMAEGVAGKSCLVHAQLNYSNTTGGPQVNIGDRDYVALVVGSCKGDPLHADWPSNVGSPGLYWGKSGELVTHCYYSRLGNDRTLPWPDYFVRADGEAVTFAVVRRGNSLEHYIYPHGFVSAVTREAIGAYNIQRPSDNITPNITMGHYGYGTPNPATGNAAGSPQWVDYKAENWEQEYYGVFLKAYDKAPSRDTIVKALKWCDNEWRNAPYGAKRLYPGLK